MDICSLFINFSPVFMPEKFESNIFLFVKPFNSGQLNVKKAPNSQDEPVLNQF